MDFKEFKKYHNANYHDGDSTFDELNYKKSNGDDFDNEFVQDCFDLDELQKRINDALNEIESGITGKYHVKRIVRILKGDQK